jgi:hypothetical protein
MAWQIKALRQADDAYVPDGWPPLWFIGSRLAARREARTGQFGGAMRGQSTRIAAVLAVLASILPAAVLAQTDEDNTEVTVNYVYAAQLGIGGYEVGGLKVEVYTLPLSQTFDLDPDDTPGDGGRPWRLKVKAPVNLGLYDFSGTDTDGSPVTASVQTLAVIPGLELQIPMSDSWTLKPFVDAGLGRNLASDGHFAYIYTVGAKSLVEQPWNDYTLMLGNGVFLAGNGTFGDSVEDYSAIETGLGIRRAVGFDMWGIEPDLGVYGIYYYYPEALEFQRYRQSTLKVRNQFEIAMSLGSADSFEIGPFANPRIGVGYIFGDGLEVLRINFGFPF